MIHTTMHGPATAARRRIAVLEIPRTEAMRLGRIGTIRAEPFALDNGQSAYGIDAFSGVYPTVTNDQAPSTAAQWIASVVQAQANARETTPGTLSYTAAPDTGPGPAVPPWVSWAGPCATGVPAAGSGGSTAGRNHEHKFWLWLAAGLGAAGSAVYLFDKAKARK